MNTRDTGRNTQAAAVIGAGVVGMATALSLQREGNRVTVFDPEPPGEACSSGNAGIIAPYPTLSEVGKRAAGTWYIPKLFSERTRKIVRFLQKF